MSMRRPRIKPQVNLAGNRRRCPKQPNDPKKSDTQYVATNESANQKANQLENANATDVNDKGNDENQVQVSVIDYNETTEDAASSTTEYVVTIQNEKPLNQKKQHNGIAKKHQDHNNTIVVENLTEVTAALPDSNQVLSSSPTFKIPNKQVSNSDSEANSGINDNVIQIDMHKYAIEQDAASHSNEESLSVNIIAPTATTPTQNNNNDSVSEDSNASNDSSVPTMPQCDRQNSASYISSPNILQQQTHGSGNKMISPILTGTRTRTESSCSLYSDSYANTQTRTRKIDEHKRTQRAHSRKNFNAVAPDKSAMKMFDLIYYNPPTNPMEIKTNKPIKEAKEMNDKLEEIGSTTSAEANDEIEAETRKTIVPQLKLNAAGELVLDDQSLEIETTAEQQAKKALANSSLIYVDEYTGMNGFYKRRPRTKDWPREETIKFYRCLQVIGTDFSCMLQLFPNRTRRDLKLKFKKEERINGQLINKALLNPKTFNVDDLKTQLEDEERERQNERQWKETMQKQPKPTKVKTRGKSTAARVLKHGDDIYDTENIQLSKRKRSNTNKSTSDVQNVCENSHEDEKNNNNNESNTNNNTSNKKKKIDENPNMEDTKVDDVPAPKKTRQRRTKMDVKEVDMLPAMDVDPIKYQFVEQQNHTETITKADGDSSVHELEKLTARQLEEEINTLISNDVEFYEQLRNAGGIAIATIRNNNDNTNGEANSYTTVMLTNEEKYLELCRIKENICSQEQEVAINETTIAEQNDEKLPQQVNNITPQADVKIDPDVNINNTVNNVDDEDCDIDEEDFRKILAQIASGSMVLVSTLDPKDPDKVLNEIYILNKETSELSDKPLNVPDDLVQSILEVIS